MFDRIGLLILTALVFFSPPPPVPCRAVPARSLFISLHPQRVCTPCKHTLELEDWRERVEWRLERVNAYLEHRLIPYFDTGVVRREVSGTTVQVPWRKAQPTRCQNFFSWYSPLTGSGSAEDGTLERPLPLTPLFRNATQLLL